MQAIEIAGHSISYRNAPDLNQKIRVLLDDLKTRRVAQEKESKQMRREERLLERFLGGSRNTKRSSAADATSGTDHKPGHSWEETHAQ